MYNTLHENISTNVFPFYDDLFSKSIAPKYKEIKEKRTANNQDKSRKKVN